MKKPLMLVPPAQAEALFDAALHDARPMCMPSANTRPSPSWETREWDDDDSFSLADGLRVPSPQRDRTVASAHD